MVIDVVLLIGFLAAAIYGFRKGIIFSLFFLIGIYVGLLASLHFSFYLSTYLTENFNISEKLLPAVSFVIMFIAVLAGLLFIAKLLKGGLKMLQLNLANRLLGMGVWLLIAGFVGCYLCFYLENSEIVSEETKENSTVFKGLSTYSSDVSAIADHIVPTTLSVHERITELMKGKAEELKESSDNSTEEGIEE